MSELLVVKYPLLTEAVRTAPTIPVDKNGKIYNFVVFPVGERSNNHDPDVLEEVVGGLIDEHSKIVDADGPIDALVSIHTMGSLLTSHVARDTKTKALVFTTEPSNEGHRNISQVRGYGDRPVYAPKFSEGAEYTIIDDVLSLGGTAEMMVDEIRRHRAVARAIIVAIDKSGNAAEISEKLELPVIALVDASAIRA